MKPDRTNDDHRMQRLRLWMLFSLLAIFICPPWPVQAQDTDDGTKAWQVDADRIEYDQINQEYVARGHVRIEQKDYTLIADSVRLNQKTHEALAAGNVRLTSGSDVLTGQKLTFNLEEQTGTLTDGEVFISQNHLYLTGSEIQKTGPQTYQAEKARITSCDGDNPDWKVTGSDFRVTIEGYGTAKHAALWAGKVPVLYSPYLIFPVKSNRQSGLLMSEIKFSDRRGSAYTQPYFWAINESSDATLYAHFMSERGVRAGLEYRYVVSEKTKGALLAEGLNDRRVDDGEGDATERWGYGDDDVLRTNEDRYWVRMKHDHDLGNGFTAKLDIDVVSDQDYLNEFRSGYNGFEKTREYFRDTFGREIDDYNESVRENQLNINRSWSRYTLNADLRWNDDVVNRQNDLPDDTLQQLPEIRFEGVKQQTGKSPFYHDLTSSYTYFHRQDGNTGHRIDLYPRIYYPFELLGALSLEPSAGIRQTAWQADFEEPAPGDEGENHSRTIYDLKLDISTEFFRVFNFGMGGSDRLKHAITPEIIYEFTPDQSQSDLPEFDEIDRIERKSLITYGINNTFTARKPHHEPGQPAAYNYTPFLRFKISQSFDINKDNDGDSEPFSNITAELDLTPGRYVSLDADAQWSVYDHQFETLNNALNLWNTRGDRLGIDYRYTRESSDTADDAIETVRLDGETVLNHRWSARAGLEHNILDDELIDSSIGLSYKSQCWGVDFDYRVEYRDDRDNQSFSVMFNLLGLGSLGY